MGNCLKTQLKENVQNEKLLNIGDSVIHVHLNADYVESTSTIKFVATEEIVFTVVGNGYLGTSFNTIESERLSSITVPANTTQNVCFSNGNYDVKVTNKYSITRIESYGGSPNNTIIPEDLFKYSSGLIKLNLNGHINCNYDVTCLKNLPLLEELALYTSKVSFNLDDFGGNIYLYSIGLNSNCTGSSLENFVALNRANGRESYNDLYIIGLPDTTITFNSERITEGHYLSWTASTITFNGVTINA